ncbi:hypothetical protein Acor_00940 [Acrocarpospora corrugata]|uniref:Uncharacterized protein n=1 Tax=Acrocarpospora corrugata TaxID=35763 RepID=A0A5M3VSK2_9ACTN|nr:hypothetical protein Acor_00940 [Acrocarpospora corrugata]
MLSAVLVWGSQLVSRTGFCAEPLIRMLAPKPTIDTKVPGSLRIRITSGPVAFCRTSLAPGPRNTLMPSR